MIQLPQLQESLLIANERLVDRARRRARLFRTGLMTSAAVVSIGGAAAAGTALWGPVLGHEDGNRPTASATPVPAQQGALLGALRRDQTSDDRGAAARQALSAVARRYVGVRLDGVRTLRGGVDGSALVLVPVARLQNRDGEPGATKDALCVAAQLPTDAALSCFTTTDVRRGAAAGMLGRLTWGVVPDGVARVVVTDPDGSKSDVPVSDNAFTVPTSSVDPERPAVEWLDDDGGLVEPTGGSPMRLPVMTAPSQVPEGFRDCGVAQGGVVPEAVQCGSASRSYRPGTTGAPLSPSDAP